MDKETDEHNHRRLWLALAASTILVIGLGLRWSQIGGFTEHVFAGLALLVATAPVAYGAVKRFSSNPFGSEVLMTIAALGAAGIGVYEEGAAVLILYNFAEAIEDYTVDKVKGIAGRMASLLPRRALAKRNDSFIEVPVEELNVGDEILVKPGWRIPVDGKVINGSSNVDQSTITGESVPVQKTSGSSVLSGTLNLEGSLEVLVEKPFKDSTISKIVNLVVEAREKKAAIERFVDRFSKFYTPSMLVLAALIAFLPPLALSQPLSVWVYRSLIVLVIACPSALVISTPVTVLMGITRAMWSSILVKGGMYLEELSKVKVVAFDKTGTLTTGKLKVAEVTPAKGFERHEVLQMAAHAEAKSSHPIATAIVNAAAESGFNPDGNSLLKEIRGRGIEAQLEGQRTIQVGRLSYLLEQGVKLDGEIAEQHGRSLGTEVEVATDGKYAGCIRLADSVRPEAREAVKLLNSKGVKAIMLTGDNETTAREIAAQLGIDNYYAELLPEDKVRMVKELKQKYGRVMMVGDGVNDAPALAVSSVGVAVGTAGNDLAIDAADIALMGSDLRKIPYLIRLGKKVVSRVKANVAIALGIKLGFIVAGTLGLIPLWVGVIGDDGATLVIIALALPLLRVRS